MLQLINPGLRWMGNQEVAAYVPHMHISPGYGQLSCLTNGETEAQRGCTSDKTSSVQVQSPLHCTALPFL